MSRYSDAGENLIRVAGLTFDVIDDADQAIETATEIVAIILDHVPVEQRLHAGALLIARALRLDPPAPPSSALSKQRGGEG